LIAIDRAESFFQRIPKPDTRCFNILMSVYAQRGDTKIVTSIMDRMRNDIESGYNSSCRPDYVTFSTAINAWRHSKDPQRWDRALRLFEEMMLRYESGDVYCRPSEHTVGSLLYLLASSDEPAAKYRTAQALIDRLDDGEYQQSPAVATAYIVACGETVGDEEALQEALQSVLRCFQVIGSDATDEVYNAVLKACHKLIKDTDERIKALEKVFKRCADHGSVSLKVLNTLRKLSPADIYLILTLQSAGKEPNMDLIPEDWKRNVISSTK